MAVGKRDARAIDRLLSAVKALPEGTQPMGVQLRGAWGNVGRGVILGWVKALGRDLKLVGLAVRRARRSPMKESGIRAMEEALWRLDSAREKLHAAISLGLGVRHLEVNVDPLRFKTYPKEIEKALRALHQANATELNDLGKQLATDRAIMLRNELSHGVAPLTSVEVRCFFEAARVEQGGQLGPWISHPDYPPSWREHNDIQPQTLWSDAVADVEKALAMLTKSVELLADLLSAPGVKLAAPSRVYYEVATGRVSLSPPP